MTYKPGHWDLPGGHLAYTESFEECLRREVQEETGLEVEIGCLLGLIKRPPGPFVQALYSCKPVSTPSLTRIQLRPDEHDDARWVAPNEIRALSPLIPYLEQVVRCGLPDRAIRLVGAGFENP
jgi:8-oxo-dGTP diphosphatase